MGRRRYPALAMSARRAGKHPAGADTPTWIARRCAAGWTGTSSSLFVSGRVPDAFFLASAAPGAPRLLSRRGNLQSDCLSFRQSGSSGCLCVCGIAVLENPARARPSSRHVRGVSGLVYNSGGKPYTCTCLEAGLCALGVGVVAGAGIFSARRIRGRTRRASLPASGRRTFADCLASLFGFSFGSFPAFSERLDSRCRRYSTSACLREGLAGRVSPDGRFVARADTWASRGILSTSASEPGAFFFLTSHGPVFLARLRSRRGAVRQRNDRHRLRVVPERYRKALDGCDREEEAERRSFSAEPDTHARPFAREAGEFCRGCRQAIVRRDFISPARSDGGGTVRTRAGRRRKPSATTYNGIGLSGHAQRGDRRFPHDRRKPDRSTQERPVRWATTEANRLPNGTADAGIVAIPVMRVGERSRTHCKATDTNSRKKPSVGGRERQAGVEKSVLTSRFDVSIRDGSSWGRASMTSARAPNLGVQRTRRHGASLSNARVCKASRRDFRMHATGSPQRMYVQAYPTRSARHRFPSARAVRKESAFFPETGCVHVFQSFATQPSDCNFCRCSCIL